MRRVQVPASASNPAIAGVDFLKSFGLVNTFPDEWHGGRKLSGYAQFELGPEATTVS